MDDLSAAHVAWLEGQRTLSANTVASRARVLRSLPNAATATRADVDAWWASRAGLADGTRVVDLSHLREFYEWCRIYEHRTDDPTIHVKAPRLGNREYEEDKVSNHQIEDLIAHLPDDLARAVRLGAGAGLRVAESAYLDWEQVNSARDVIRVVRSKNKRTRDVPVSPDLIRMLGVGTDCTGNVVAGGGPPIPASSLQKRLNRAMRKAGAEFTSHDLRHRFGIAAYRASQDLLAVGEMMGHQNVNTTKLYASADSEVKRKIAAAVMW